MNGVTSKSKATCWCVWAPDVSSNFLLRSSVVFCQTNVSCVSLRRACTEVGALSQKSARGPQWTIQCGPSSRSSWETRCWTMSRCWLHFNLQTSRRQWRQRREPRLRAPLRLVYAVARVMFELDPCDVGTPVVPESASRVQGSEVLSVGWAQFEGQSLFDP